LHKRFTQIARNLRKNFTEAERHLWKYLSRRQLEGYKFRRQQPIGQYIVDFINFERKIVIEIDGGQHTIETEKDKERDKWLREQGFEVLRFWNNEIFENIEGVIEVIRRKLLSPSPPSPPTRGGENGELRPLHHKSE
jgi:very-short-patch-repair endonuclease